MSWSWQVEYNEHLQAARAAFKVAYVSTVSGPAHWDVARGEVVLDGPSSAPFTAGG